MDKEKQEIGFIDNGTGKHQSNTVYNPETVSPTITTLVNGGTQQIKIIVACRGRESVRVGVSELRPVCTEYENQIRKSYESHTVYEKRKNMQQLEPRTDGLTNTITTVLKDNLVLEIWENPSE